MPRVQSPILPAFYKRNGQPRPCTANDIATILKMSPADVAREIHRLRMAGAILRHYTRDGGAIFTAAEAAK